MAYHGLGGTVVPDPEAAGVLPRPVRRVFRLAVSLANGRVAIPRFAGIVGAAVLFASTGLYGMVLGGHTGAVAEATTSAIGFSIDNVKVSGNLQTSEIDILQQLGLDGSSSVVFLSAANARQKLMDLPWVENAEVRKVYPNTVEIKLSERTAYGIWQHGDELSLIEKDGKVIAPLRDNKFASLPLFVGDGAQLEAAAFAEQLSNWPDIQSRITAYICVGGRRWDLRMDNGVVVRLPEENIARAMHALSTLEQDQQVLERDIQTVDLRLPDRTTIQLTADAAVRRDKAVADRAKMLKKQMMEKGA
ncbi:cell division protein FtsQ/DivIB [Rhizobium sp. C1]|uniref:cell division protein FtsQ/DivIB n=1 Tax=Rhizobium sp. C1 TaxID=1349799 RepID=UPI001E4AEB41|nr:cell division protein FtsQ/DivIB [Rhizobium sp. C1]MCD2176551.1 cell division protein FtsQ/DivIB [Rhizobium sp. C1]